MKGVYMGGKEDLKGKNSAYRGNHESRDGIEDPPTHPRTPKATHD